MPKCPQCGSPGYEGLFAFECAGLFCPNYKPSKTLPSVWPAGWAESEYTRPDCTVLMTATSPKACVHVFTDQVYAFRDVGPGSLVQASGMFQDMHAAMLCALGCSVESSYLPGYSVAAPRRLPTYYKPEELRELVELLTAERERR